MVSGFGGAAATAVLRYDVDTTSAEGGLAGLARSAGPPLAVLGVLSGVVTGLGVRATMAGDEIAKMSARTGLSVVEVQELAHAAEQGGSSIGSLENGIRRMQRVVVDADNGLGQAVDTLEQLGLTSRDLRGLLPREQLGLFADALAEVDDASVRSALAQQVFGRSGTELIPVLAEGEAGLRAYAEEKQRLGTLSAEEAGNAEDAADAYQELTTQVGTLSNRILLNLVPAFTRGAVASTLFIDAAERGLGDAFDLFDEIGDRIDAFVDEAGNVIGDFTDAFANAGLSVQDLVNVAEDLEQRSRDAAEAERDLANDTDAASDALDRQAIAVVTLTEGLATLSGEILALPTLLSAEEAAAIGIGGAGSAFRNPTADAGIRALRNRNAGSAVESARAAAEATRAADNAARADARAAAVAARELDRKAAERNRLLMTAEERLQSLRDEAEGLTAAQVELRGVNESVRAAVEAGDTELRDVYIETGLLLAAQIAEEAEESRESASADTSTTVAAIDRIGARLLRGGSSDRLASLAFEGGGTGGARSAQLYRNYLQQREGGDGDLLNAVEFGNLTLAEQRRLTGSRVVGGGGEQVVVRVEIAGQQFDDAVAQAERRNAEVGA